MSFMDAVKAVLTNYVGFSGRARRSEYWYWVLFQVALAVVLGIIAGIIKTNILGMLVNLALLLPSLAVSVRRLHDIGKSGWFLLLALIPLVGAIILIVWACQDSQAGANQYGANPKAGPAQTAVA
jgi:uncharacterized membrane protein YhaH (DUF805 family)